MKKIAVLLIGEIKYDGRVQKEINTLRRMGYKVELFVSRFKNDYKENYSFKIHSYNYNIVKSPVKNLINKFAFCKKIQLKLKKMSPDIIHCNDLDTLYGGILYKRKYPSVQIVYDAHELFPEMQNDIVRKLFWNILERIYIKKIDKLLVPEKNRGEYLLRKYGIDRCYIIENFPKKSKLIDDNFIEEEYEITKEKVKILYLGALLKERKVEEIIKALKYLSEDYILIMIGKINKIKYRKKLVKIIKENNLERRVILKDPILNKFVINYINSCDVGLVFYENININNYYCASNKLYEFITCRKAVITNGYPGLIEVVEKNGYGVCISDVNENTIAKSLQKITGFEFNDKQVDRYFWDNQETIFKEIYE